MLLLLAALITLPSIAKLAWAAVELLAKLVVTGIVIGVVLLMFIAFSSHGRIV